MTDIVERLRAATAWNGSLSDQAANEIERLRAALKKILVLTYDYENLPALHLDVAVLVRKTLGHD